MDKKQSIAMWCVSFVFFFCSQIFAAEGEYECNKPKIVKLTAISNAKLVIYETDKVILRFNTDDLIAYLNADKITGTHAPALLKYLENERKSEKIMVNNFLEKQEKVFVLNRLEYAMADFLKKGNAEVYNKKAGVNVPSIIFEYQCSAQDEVGSFTLGDGTLFLNVLYTIID